jgi:hypothetical protein
VFLASYDDPLKKREEFAVSLRKKKAHELITAKRRKLMGGASSNVPGGEMAEEESKSSGGGTETKTTLYRGYHTFDTPHGNEMYEKLLAELCPMASQLRRDPSTKLTSHLIVGTIVFKPSVVHYYLSLTGEVDAGPKPVLSPAASARDLHQAPPRKFLAEPGRHRGAPSDH